MLPAQREVGRQLLGVLGMLSTWVALFKSLDPSLAFSHIADVGTVLPESGSRSSHL